MNGGRTGFLAIGRHQMNIPMATRQQFLTFLAHFCVSNVLYNIGITTIHLGWILETTFCKVYKKMFEKMKARRTTRSETVIGVNDGNKSH